jgi:hypothetical protein
MKLFESQGKAKAILEPTISNKYGSVTALKQRLNQTFKSRI